MASSALAGRQLRKSTLLSRIQEQKAASAPVLKEKPQRHERGRRSLLKRRPVKGVSAVATTRVSCAVTHRGLLYTVGDIVAIESDNETLYAQITGLLTDPFGEKSASLAWLVPTDHSRGFFDPATWVFGASDDTPRKLDKLRYVQHVSPEHFKSGIVRI